MNCSGSSKCVKDIFFSLKFFFLNFFFKLSLFLLAFIGFFPTVCWLSFGYLSSKIIIPNSTVVVVGTTDAQKVVLLVGA